MAVRFLQEGDDTKVEVQIVDSIIRRGQESVGAAIKIGGAGNGDGVSLNLNIAWVVASITESEPGIESEKTSYNILG